MTSGSDPVALPLTGHDRWLRAFVRQLVATTDVDDVVQSTWLAALQRQNGDRRLLAGIARRLAALMHRSRARRVARERSAAAAANAPSTLVMLERLETLQRVAAAVCALPEPYRSTLLRHHEAGHGIDAIAREDGIAEAAVRKRLQRARELVRQQLGEGARMRTWLPWLGLSWTRRSARSASAIAWLTAAVTVAAAVAWQAAHFAALPAPTALPGPAAVDAGQRLAAALPAAAPAPERTLVAAIDPGTQDPAAAARPRQIVVTVRHADGAPGAKAEVRLGKDHRLADAAGIVRFEVLAGALVPDRITARLIPSTEAGPEAPRHLALRDGLRRALAERPGDITFDLRLTAPLLSIHGRVIDANGRPVPKAFVFLAEAEPLDPESQTTQWSFEDLSTHMEGEVIIGEGRCASANFATTDADGIFVLRNLRERPYSLRAVHWASSRTVVVPAIMGGARDVAMQLPDAPRRRLRGTVHDPAGRPLADIQVVALLPLLCIAGVQEHHIVGETRSGADGAFELAAPSSATELGIRGKDWLRTQVAIPTADAPVPLVTDQPHELEFALSGRLADTASIELLDATERPLPAFPHGPWSLPGTSHRYERPSMHLWTRRDAAMARLRGADGAVLQLIPLVPRADECVTIR